LAAAAHCGAWRPYFGGGIPCKTTEVRNGLTDETEWKLSRKTAWNRVALQNLPEGSIVAAMYGQGARAVAPPVSTRLRLRLRRSLPNFSPGAESGLRLVLL